MVRGSRPKWAVYLVLFSFVLSPIAQAAEGPAQMMEHKDDAPVSAQVPPENMAMSGPGLIDMHLRNTWQKKKLIPSAIEEDNKIWMRRAYLDIVGRIPTTAEIAAFVAKPDRPALCQTLVQNPDFNRHMANIWADAFTHAEADLNSRPGQVNRMATFLEPKFRAGESWDKIARDVLASNQFRQANSGGENRERETETASKVVLGIRTECAKCHNQPDLAEGARPANASAGSLLTQREYAALNALFQGQTTAVTGATREGEIFTVNPGFAGQTGNVGQIFTRHDSFAKAFVNRTWGHLFGRGLNSAEIDDFRVDDKVNHPELLRDLSAKFVAGGYNPRSLVLWMCQSNAYNLSSAMNKSNVLDDHYFSKFNPKRMSVKQLAESLPIALGQNRAEKRAEWEGLLRGRNVRTEDGDGTMRDGAAFDDDAGNPARASMNILNVLFLMNSEEINTAVKASPIVRANISDEQKVNLLMLSTLTRMPKPEEMQMMRGFNKEDLLWSLLNSNEFILNH